MFQTFDYFFDYLNIFRKKKSAENPVFSRVFGNKKKAV